MAFLTTFFNHAQAVRRAAGSLGIHAVTRLSDFGLQISAGDRKAVWAAKFMAHIGGRLMYTDSLVKGTAGFAGWMPYPLRQWPIALEKSAFKRYAIQNEIPTPAACFDPALIGGPFIIKRDNSSFGEGIRGPYWVHDAGNPAHALEDGEYYENFIVGHIAKAWCWGDRCVAVHLHPPGMVVGDGSSTLRQLMEGLPNTQGSANDWDLIARLGACCGIGSIDDVVDAGKEVLVEFRYGSRYEVASYDNPNVLDRIASSGLAAQFAEGARKFTRAIPAQPGAGPSLFTLDAMVDGQGQVLFLEMNCNPLVHPDLYEVMLRSWVEGEVLKTAPIAAA
jgi:hypothetical protein